MEESLVHEFVATTGRMFKSLSEYQSIQRIDPQAAKRLLADAAATGCSLLRDQGYLAAIVGDADRLSASFAENREVVQDILGPGHFAYFLRGEAKLLNQAGADPALVKDIIHRCEAARAAAGSGQLDLDDFRAALEEAASALCDCSAELDQAIVDEHRRRSLVRRIRSGFAIVCGATVVGLNASIFAAAMGLTVPGAAASCAIGGAIVSHGFSELRPKT